MPPYLSKTAPWFTFLVHPRNTQDLLDSAAGRFLHRYSSDLDDFRRRMCGIPPFVAGEVVFGPSQLKGEIIAVMCMPETLISKSGRDSVLAAATLAMNRGSRFLGLGGLTSPATLGGEWLLKHLSRRMIVTNGNAYTAAVVRRNVHDASRQLSLGTKARVAVVGCTGSVGFAASNLLAEDGHCLYLVGRSASAVRKRFIALPRNAQITDLDMAVAEADIIVLLTNDPTSSIKPYASPRPGAVVIDCAQPPNLSTNVVERLTEAGAIVVDGGLVRIPNFHSTYDFKLRAPDLTFSCLAETYLFARHGLNAHSVGHPSPNLSIQIEMLAQKSEIQISPLTAHNTGS